MIKIPAPVDPVPTVVRGVPQQARPGWAKIFSEGFAEIHKRGTHT